MSSPDLTIHPHPSPGSSFCWKHMGFRKDKDGNLVKTLVYCMHCQQKLAYHNSTTSMANHLKKHGITNLSTLAQEESRKPPKISEQLRQQTINPSATSNHPKADLFTDSLCRMLAGANLPFSIVEHPDFIAHHRRLQPGYKVPCRSTITRKVITMAEQMKAEVKSEIASVTRGMISCTHDSWTSRDNITYGGMYLSKYSTSN